jgi:hypothetical protein
MEDMKKLNKSLYLVLCLLVGVSLSGCIEEFKADIPEDDSELLVVEGSICASRLNKFTLSRTMPLNTSTTPQKVTGASVSVRGSDGSEYIMLEADGYYGSWIDALAPDVAYYLHIETGGEVYESEPQKPLRTEPIADVVGVQNTTESNIDVLITPAAPYEPDHANYYSWTYDETWEVHADYTTNMYFDKATMRRMYQAHLFPEVGWKDASGTTIMVGASTNYDGQQIRQLKLYDLDRSNERVWYMYSGLVSQRAITKAEYEYELARRQAGSEMGGLFTPQPSALPTNIHCLTSSKHVIGYVGCSLNVSDYRFFLDADDFSIEIPQREDSRLWIDNCNEEICAKMVDKGMFLCVWDDNRISFGTLKTAWAYERQLDVRYKGAYIERPDYWPVEEDENDEDE